MKDFKPLSDEDAQGAVDALRQHGSQRAAAVALGIATSTFQNRLKRAAERGLSGFDPVMPGFVVDRVSTDTKSGESWVRQVREPGEEYAVPVGHRVKGESALVDADGRVRAKWVKTREGDLDPMTVVEWIKAAFADYQPAAEPTNYVPVAPGMSETLTLFPVNDWHVGMHAWGREVGTDWDLKIAERVLTKAMRDVLDRTPMSGTCVVLGGGDLLHADNSENRTLRSGNALDVDGRYQKVISVACRLAVSAVDMALERHTRVIFRNLPGNHDENTAHAITYFMMAWYRNEPRVTVDTDPSLFWWHRFGKVLLGATHGHTIKIKQMPSIMAHRRAEDWGATRFRYVHGFHVHHKEMIATEGEGVICETHQAPIPSDAWHWGSGFLSGRSMQTITYHRETGESGRARVSILDGEKK